MFRFEAKKKYKRKWETLMLSRPASFLIVKPPIKIWIWQNHMFPKLRLELVLTFNDQRKLLYWLTARGLWLHMDEDLRHVEDYNLALVPTWGAEHYYH